jgi:hypothetical protein
LPLVFGPEQIFPPSAQFDTREFIDIDANPHAVWHAIVTMAPLTETPAPPFRFGATYPLSAGIDRTNSVT